MILSAVGLVGLACAGNAPVPTLEPLPTYTPYPTYTPVPTPTTTPTDTVSPTIRSDVGSKMLQTEIEYLTWVIGLLQETSAMDDNAIAALQADSTPMDGSWCDTLVPDVEQLLVMSNGVKTSDPPRGWESYHEHLLLFWELRVENALNLMECLSGTAPTDSAAWWAEQESLSNRILATLESMEASKPTAANESRPIQAPRVPTPSVGFCSQENHARLWDQWTRAIERADTSGASRVMVDIGRWNDQCLK